MAKVYAVKNGRKIGIFNSWSECQESISGFSGADFKSFKNKEDAIEYLGDLYKEEPKRKEVQKDVHLSDDIKDEVKWLLEQIVEQAWCGMAELVENYVGNICDALEITIDTNKQ